MTDTLTDREKALVEAARLMQQFSEPNANGRYLAADEKLKAALRAYDPPKPKVPVMPPWDDLPKADKYALEAARSANSIRHLYEYIRELTAKDSA